MCLVTVVTVDVYRDGHKMWSIYCFMLPGIKHRTTTDNSQPVKILFFSCSESACFIFGVYELLVSNHDKSLGTFVLILAWEIN